MIKNNYSNTVTGFLIFFLLLTPIIGVAITEIFVLLLISLFLINILNSNFFLASLSRMYILPGIFILYVILNGLIQINDDDFFYRNIFYFRYFLLIIAIVYFLEKNIFDSKKIFNIIFIFTLFVSLDALIQFFTGINAIGYEIPKNFNRVTSFFNDEGVLGYFFFKILLFFSWAIFFLKINLKKKKLLITFIYSAASISIYLSAERTAFFLLILFYLFIFLSVKPIRDLIRNSICILILFIFISSIFSFGKTRPLNRIFIKTFNQITSNIFTNDPQLSDKAKNGIVKNLKVFSRDHQEHYFLAIYLFKQKPIFGFGPRGFRSYCRKVKYKSQIGICSTHPHNFFIQILSELGAFGLFFLLFLYFFIIKNFFFLKNELIKNSLSNDCFMFLISSINLLLLLFPFVPSGNFFNSNISINLFFFLGLYLYSYKKCFFKNL